MMNATTMRYDALKDQVEFGVSATWEKKVAAKSNLEGLVETILC